MSAPLIVNALLLPALYCGGVTGSELRRLEPAATVICYEGATVQMTSDRVLILFVEDAPPDFRKAKALGASDLEKRYAYVFVKDLERFLSCKRTDDRFALAAARIVAHEVEHVRRQSREHDSRGWFTSCVDKRWLTQIGG